LRIFINFGQNVIKESEENVMTIRNVKDIERFKKAI
jgi:hypothetical protein